MPSSEDLTAGIVPPISPAPEITREFVSAPWHRPRKQYIRKYQWNHEVVELMIKSWPQGSGRLLKMLGLPSSEYLDLLSMRTLCEAHGFQVLYLGFDASQNLGPYATEQPTEIDVYQTLHERRVLATSSFVHPSSTVIPDIFETIRKQNSMSRNRLKSFGDFDVINLDLCGCIVGQSAENANDALDAVAELLRLQGTYRLRPWLFFITTFASASEINLPGCRQMINAVVSNADKCEEFNGRLKARATLDSSELRALFEGTAENTLSADEFIRIFALALGKWLAAKLKLAVPPSFVSMLPSYCFRHKGREKAELLSLAYLVEPKLTPCPPGDSMVAPPVPDYDAEYRRMATKIIDKSFSIRDLDRLIDENAELRGEVASETQELLVECGFDGDSVREFLGEYH